MNSRVVTAFVLNSCVSVKSAWKGQRSNSSCFQISPALCRRNLLLLQDNHCKVWLTVVIFFSCVNKKVQYGSAELPVFCGNVGLILYLFYVFLCTRWDQKVLWTGPEKWKWWLISQRLCAILRVAATSNHCCIPLLLHQCVGFAQKHTKSFGSYR